MTEEEKREAYARLGILEWMDLRDKFEAERAAEAMRNDPYQINRYTNFDGASCMHLSLEGELVYYADYIEKIERLKAIHEKGLKEAYSRGQSDGKSSNYSWRV